MRLQVTCTRATSGHRDVPTCPNSEDLRGTVVSGYCAVTRSFQTMVWRTYLIYLVYDIRCTYTFAIPSIVFALVFSLPPNRSSDPGSYTRPFSPRSTAVRAFSFVWPEDFSPFFLSSTRVELSLPTLRALSSRSFSFLEICSKSHPTVGLEIQDQRPTLTAVEDNH